MATKKIKLTQGKVAIVDAEDFDWLNQWKWYSHSSKGKTYAVRNTPRHGGGQSSVRMHREIMKSLKGADTDHIDGNTLNNSKKNLRVCSHRENCRNKVWHTKNSSGYKGVTWHKKEKKWRAQICVNYKKIVLGRFSKVKEAALAYDAAAKKFFGEYALTNFPA